MHTWGDTHIYAHWAVCDNADEYIALIFFVYAFGWCVCVCVCDRDRRAGIRAYKRRMRAGSSFSSIFAFRGSGRRGEFQRLWATTVFVFVLLIQRVV